MQKVILLICILTIVFVGILIIATSYSIKVILMSDRKSSKLMLEELWYNFNTDYRDYQHLPKEEVSLKSYDGLKLYGVYHNLYPDSKKVVIINHGYTANHYVSYQFTDAFFEEGFNALLIDMRSHGYSEGIYASYGLNESRDMDLWVNWIKNKVGDNAYVGLHGQSMGAATVMIYGGSHSKDIKFIVEDCGFSNARDAIKFQFKQAKIPFLPLFNIVRFKINKKFKFDLNTISPLDVITTSSVPTLFIHGIDDKIVPYYMSKEMYEKKNGPKDMLYLVEGAGHIRSCAYDKEKYKCIVKEFLNKI